MKKNLAVLLLAGIPLISNSYTITVHNNSSIKMKLKEKGGWCFKITPRKLILNPGETEILNYEFFKNFDFCNADLNIQNGRIYQIILRGFPVTSEDPELEDFDYIIGYYNKDFNIDNATACKSYTSTTKVCLWNGMSEINKEYAPYKITADFDSITIIDK